MKLTKLFLVMLIFPAALPGRTIIVDVNGSGQFTSIVAAMPAAANGDTVKVLPGVYDGAFTMSKNIVLMGSGYETTIISSNSNPTLTMNGGKMIWFAVTSNLGDGIWFLGGQVANCIVRGCASRGISLRANSSGIVSNCVIYQNGGGGIVAEGGGNSVSVYNCISRANASVGYYGQGSYLIVSYSCGSLSGYITGNVGNIDIDPRFNSSSDFHISSSSPAWNAGRPDVFDPDGSRSDMGYFGGPDCPIYPVVTDVQVIATPGGVQIRATGRANY